MLATKLEHQEDHWEQLLPAARRRVIGLLQWPSGQRCERWRLIEAWTHAAHGPHLALAGGFRLAFWAEQHEHHGPRLDRALARYERFATARPPGWPASGVAGFATFLTTQLQRLDGPEHGMAYDVQRFNELTKQMSAYHHYQRPEHLQLAAARAERRRRAQQIADELNTRLRFRTREQSPSAWLRRASQLLDSEHPTHRATGRVLYAKTQREQQLTQRDQRLLAGQHPSNSDSRYRAACTHAERWGLSDPAPTPSRSR